jgi:tRNA (guanine26-N2/guanine27-N2)-dimethyltransferase
MFKDIKEANVVIKAPVEEKVSKDLPVFYNPAMKFNRDSSVLLLKATGMADISVCDLLAGTGIRSVRFLAELGEKIRTITINDNNPESIGLIKENLEINRNNFKGNAEIKITNEDASILLLKSTGFNYIDIDPFGTPNPFLDSAIIRLARDGILAVTATDTSSLAGTYPDVCQRRYWAKPSKGPLKHEIGLRILIRKVQLIGAQYEKALIPIFSYAKEHYMRVFFRCDKGKSKADKIMIQHGDFMDAGPMWLGSLWDKDLVDKMYTSSLELDYEFDSRFLQTIRDESKLDVVGFYDVHDLCRQDSLQVPPFDDIYRVMSEKGYIFTRTHFSPYGIRSNIPEDELVEILKKVAAL